MRSGVRCRVLQAEARLWSQQVIYSVQQLQDSSCSGTMRHWQRAAGMPTVAWSERRYDCVFCTLCLDSCPPPPHCISLLYTVSFFLSSSLSPPLLPIFTERVFFLFFCFCFPSTWFPRHTSYSFPNPYLWFFGSHLSSLTARSKNNPSGPVTHWPLQIVDWVGLI